jgi:hypothetical protein
MQCAGDWTYSLSSNQEYPDWDAYDNEPNDEQGSATTIWPVVAGVW